MTGEGLRDWNSTGMVLERGQSARSVPSLCACSPSKSGEDANNCVDQLQGFSCVMSVLFPTMLFVHMCLAYFVTELFWRQF